MPWLYVPASEDSSSDSSSPSQPLERCVTWRGKPIRSASRSRVFGTVISTMLRYGAMSNPSTVSPGVMSWISSLAVIRANHFPSPVDVKAKTILGTSGRTSSALSKKSSRDTAFLKTWLTTFNLVLNRYGETYQIWTTRLRRDSLRRQKLARRINGSGCLSWPTATSALHDSQTYGSDYRIGIPKAERRTAFNLQGAAKNWATPMAADDGKKVTTSSLQAGLIGQASGFYGHPIPTIAKDGRTLYASSRVLNPVFVEWLMGFPIGWTALAPLETQSFQRWRRQHGTIYETNSTAIRSNGDEL